MSVCLLVFALLIGCGGQTDAAPDPGANVPDDPADVTPPEDDPATDAGVTFAAPLDGATVTSPVHLKFQVKGKKVIKAGDVTKGTGHHHVLVDAGFIDKGLRIPKDASHIHYGGGEREARLPLQPGEHTLTLQFGNGAHVSFGEAWSKTITVTVE